MNRVYLGLGSNIEPQKHCVQAIAAIKAVSAKIRCSTAYQSDAVGFDGPKFVNLVVEMETELTLEQVATFCRELEFTLGRPELAEKNQNRTIDIDILLFNDLISNTPSIPRTDIHQFAFVLLPMYELAPNLVIPGTVTSISQLWEQRQHQLLVQQPITPIQLDC